ncbi:hypothetical protein [uncultured Sphingomonas sp.]|uniref:hypothetical protein n=1 Tax=uncultured Sphingomonas sp. TaxID=158754 RepID=UPI0025F4EC85|nr:hypothetical protein [uncultured Sphingomonas sp.]
MSIARTVVYFAYLGDEGTDDDVVRRRLSFMARQLQWLSDLIALSQQRIAVVVPYVAPRAWDGAVQDAVGAHDFRVDPASIAAERRNRFEYPGFLTLKRLAQQSPPDDLLFYCHSKGIVELSDNKMGLFRLHTAVGLTADLHRLNSDPGRTRAGLFPSRYGWCWYNIFWIKAGHMADLPVEESDDRYHFEALIGGVRHKDGYRGVLPLIDRVPVEESGIAAKPWYHGGETTSPTLLASYDRYAAMTSPADARRDGRG